METGPGRDGARERRRQLQEMPPEAERGVATPRLLPFSHCCVSHMPPIGQPFPGGWETEHSAKGAKEEVGLQASLP